MKIMHICTDKNIGGAGRWILNLVGSQAETEMESTVLLPVGAKLTREVKALGVSVIELPMQEKSFDLAAILPMRRVILQQKPDIIHTHGSFSGRIAGKLAGKKIVITRHWAKIPEDSVKSKNSWLARCLNNYLSDKWIATSNQAAENLAQSGIAQRKIVTISNGARALEKKADSWILEKRNALEISGFVFGILARLEEVKGHKYILEAASLLKEKNLDFTILIAGSGSLEEKLKAQSRDLGLEKHIKFLGFFEAPEEFLNLLDVQINASYTETTCLALLEGFSIGLSAIASTGGGNPDLIQEGENGLLFEVGKPEQLAEKMQKMMGDTSLQKTLAKGAKDCFDKTYTAEQFAGQVANLYKEIQNERT